MLRDDIRESLFAILPDRLRMLFDGNGAYDFTSLTEIRLRLNKPIILYCKGDALFFTHGGAITHALFSQCINADKKDIEQTVARCTGYSLYSHFDDIAGGFITAPGGHRVGVCATGVKNGRGFRDIESVNIRVASAYFGCAEEIFGGVFSDGLRSFLIAGEPGSGKTTVLRDCARYLSENSRFCYPRITVADERREISACMHSERLKCCDIIKGLTKEQSFEHALRTLCPDIVLTDEIAAGDISAVEKLADCGVFIGATVHAGSFDELKDKYGFGRLLERGIFTCVIILKGKSAPGTADKIIML